MGVKEGEGGRGVEEEGGKRVQNSHKNKLIKSTAAYKAFEPSSLPNPHHYHGFNTTRCVWEATRKP